MAKQRLQSDVLSPAAHALLKEAWAIDGRADALKYAIDCNGDIAQLRARIQEVEERIHEPSESMKGPMSPGASPRLYQDGYLRGLKEAIDIIESVEAAMRETTLAQRA